MFRQKLHEQAPRLEIKDLDPILDAMRSIKSPREVALIREATRIAGVTMIEAMKAAKTGNARVRDRSHRRLRIQEEQCARSGVLRACGDGHELVLAALSRGAEPTARTATWCCSTTRRTIKYYASDVTREFPASGKFSADQRELYGVYVKLYQALMTSIRPNVTARAVIQDAVKKMDAILANWQFTKEKYRQAAQRFVDYYRNSWGAAWDIRWGWRCTTCNRRWRFSKPGYVFTIEPALTVPEDRIYIRLEDVIVITENGYENLSAFVPETIEEVEKVMARGK